MYLSIFVGVIFAFADAMAITRNSRFFIKENSINNKKLLAKNNTVVTCLGGSSTAGGGKISLQGQYPTILRDLLNNDTKYNRSKVYNMAHGNSNTFYNALNFKSLVRPESSVITWEFAINDWYKNCIATQDALLFFMDQVQGMTTKPTVIFIILWNTPFVIPPKRNVWNCIAPLLKNQLVINVNEFVDKECSRTNCKKTDFVSDRHHMNNRMHRFVARELYSILKNRQNLRHPIERDMLPHSGDMLTHSVLFDKPSIDHITDVKYAFFGRSSPNRKDRQVGLVLQQCNDSFRMPIDPKWKICFVNFGAPKKFKPLRGSSKDLMPYLVDKLQTKVLLSQIDAPFKLPNYHGYFNDWYKPDKYLNFTNMSICAKTQLTLRWISVIFTLNKHECPKP
tara:strand:+ start:213 stop:1394 length:1182 start_codon:yes stop_codon:yes gene_type:complete